MIRDRDSGGIRFTGLVSAADRSRALNPDRLAEDEIRRDLKLVTFAQAIQQVNAPYFKEIEFAATYGDAEEIITPSARNRRALVATVARQIDKLGIPATKALKADEKLATYEVKWADQLEVPDHFMGEARTVVLTSRLNFEKNFDPARHLRSYVLDIERPGEEKTASLTLGLNQERITSYQLQWEGRDWSIMLDTMVATRLLDGQTPPYRDRYTPLGLFMRDIGYIPTDRYKVPFTKGVLNLDYATKPQILTEGEVGKSKLGILFEYDSASGDVTRELAAGENPERFYWGTESNSHRITQADYINLMRALLVLIPTTIPEETKQALAIDMKSTW